MARGRSARWTESEIDRMAKVGPKDVDDADRAWRRDAPGPYRTLLRAVAMVEKVSR